MLFISKGCVEISSTVKKYESFCNLIDINDFSMVESGTAGSFKFTIIYTV